MNRFVDRGNELRQLDACWKAPAAQLVVIVGKRRVGKTALLRRWMADKPAVYYLADRRPEADNLRELARRLGDHFGDDFVGRKGFEDWLEAFAYLKERVRAPFALVIDEYPYLTDGNLATSSLFQKGWDETLRGTPLRLVLCGSSLSMMVKETLGRDSPLFGRRTGDVWVRPLDFSAVSEFFGSGMSFERCVETYSLLGGMPGYFSQMDPALGLVEALGKALLRPGTFLFREVEFLLREEVREPRAYLAILAAIAQGKHKHGEIVNAAGIAATARKYFDTLDQLELVQREVPVTEERPEKSKRSLYRLSDPFVRLWFEVVYPFGSELELGNTRPALARLRAALPAFLGPGYERIARETLRRQDLPLDLRAVGRWWDSETEIDAVGLGADGKSILFAEAKWRNAVMDVGDLHALRSKAARVAWGSARQEVFALFSKSGFSPRLRRAARAEGALLFHGTRRVA
jgi:uncharacterized protein